VIVQLKMFAVARQLAGQDVVELTLPEGARVADLRGCLAEKYPELADLSDHLMFAIDTEYVSNDTEIPVGAEVACIPPVSGG